MARVAALLVLAALLVPATASAVTVPAVQYTAAIEGTDAFVGIVKRGARFRAHVSDATAKGATLSVWFRGDLGPDGHVSGSAHGFRLEAELGRGSGTGTVTLPDGRAFEFAADSGFGGALIERSYRHAGRHYLSGWVVLRDKRVRGRTSLPGTALGGSSATGPGIRASPPLGSQIAHGAAPRALRPADRGSRGAPHAERPAVAPVREMGAASQPWAGFGHRLRSAVPGHGRSPNGGRGGRALQRRRLLGGLRLRLARRIARG